MTDKQLSTDAQLDLIVEMINKSKNKLATGGSFYFLLWGWTIMLANLGHFIIDKFDLYPAPYIVWMITIPAGIASMIYGMKSSKNLAAKNHMDNMYSYIWLGAFITCISIIFFVPDARFLLTPIILAIAGMATFLSGLLLRFTPLVIGGITLWIAAIVASQLPEVYHYLLGAIGIFLGYLVPGYLLKKAENA